MTTNEIALGLTHSFAEACAGCFMPWQPAQVPQPRGLIFNRGLAQVLGLDADALFTEQGAAMLAGNVLPSDAQPLAQAYAGHQFGNFAPQNQVLEIMNKSAITNIPTQIGNRVADGPSCADCATPKLVQHP